MANTTESTRLNKYLALQLGISRREADEYIERGQVTVNDKAVELGAQITKDAVVTVKGNIIGGHVVHAYLLFNKPAGYVCSRKQQGDAPTIYDLIPSEYKSLKTVGRLDKDSSGLIILTNDGDFAFHMTHPKFYKVKVYGVHLDRDLAPLHQQMISDHGITLDDGPSKFELERVSDDRRDMWRIRMSEGRNRQIRRTFSAIGYTVTALHRTDFGPYTLGDLEPGKYRITNKR
ncbi:ribosomal large subunit pseudouridine synthase B [Candidatus Saccharibacteria bacterium RIFCSPHIGHO2_01_FULL_45_15]|nr:MAG: ribosomal large subunit pseudouridine synthase B [Candidatus Saccharibacteria bacterium RIFCSPHIGHO2_01_FULL_45_15]OGL28925.1 MAG: ribosomal large subunit pseudouridine synthase B [Candidatus Saccharibacteria bacterium RIFCSPHIGHO2_02_FULL_46_12]OGL31938.1 MAG: ribosomal large subunit pseudouridine synthase B [Candidatus Saccharibacteria bacterium RIFCSPHIGHO2_12_FULL_44_22]